MYILLFPKCAPVFVWFLCVCASSSPFHENYRDCLSIPWVPLSFPFPAALTYSLLSLPYPSHSIPNEAIKINSDRTCNFLSPTADMKQFQEVNMDEIHWTYSVKWFETDVKERTRWQQFDLPGAKDMRVIVLVIDFALVLLLGLGLCCYSFCCLDLSGDVVYSDDDDEEAPEKKSIRSTGQGNAVPSAVDEEWERELGELDEDTVNISMVHLDRRASSDEQLDNDSMALANNGWQAVAHDVFRSPPQRNVLAVLVGSGLHIWATIVPLLLLLVFGGVPYSSEDRGVFIVRMLLLYMCIGPVAGYVSATIYKMMRRRMDRLSRRRNLFGTACGIPCALMGVYVFMSIYMELIGSTYGVEFGTYFTIMLLWVSFQFPSTLIGGIYGFKRRVAKPPQSVNSISRMIPPTQFWFPFSVLFNPTSQSILAGGIIFSSCVLEYYYILQSIWLENGRPLCALCDGLTLVFIFVLSLELSVILTLFQLNREVCHVLAFRLLQHPFLFVVSYLFFPTLILH